MFVRLLRLPPEKMKESGERRASERAMKMLLLMLVAAAAAAAAHSDAGLAAEQIKMVIAPNDLS